MITIVGIGPGNPKFWLQGVYELVEAADLIIGSKRQLEMVPREQQQQTRCLPKKMTELEAILRRNSKKKVVVLASGEPLLYGIGAWASKHFLKEELELFPGISSIHYLFNVQRISFEDCFLTSSHGKLPDFDFILSLAKVAMVTDQKIGPYEIAQACLKRGLRKELIIGENLSYPTERIRRFSAREVPKEEYDMNVVVILDEG